MRQFPNRASNKDNYPVPPMEQILQQVSGSERLSLLDGFLGYNQVLMSPLDQLKTTFRTPWGMYTARYQIYKICRTETKC
jgi:hypothetical protein